ncbi:hypothetical protein TcasGA2_TC014064 [Tribolium castaneum]|uniref:Uncharacterized protein n=1 Tax=Tribolium castaneum TaxID=7070 RepID=D6WK02_TRICA|nr:hypothetical protein TcasGA2_TC014064 [Tribolium castaneum]
MYFLFFLNQKRLKCRRELYHSSGEKTEFAESRRGILRKSFRFDELSNRIIVSSSIAHLKSPYVWGISSKDDVKEELTIGSRCDRRGGDDDDKLLIRLWTESDSFQT